MWCKVEFSSLLQFSVSRDLLEIIIIYFTQEICLIIIKLKKKSCLMLCGTGDALYFSGFFNKYKV